MELNDYASRSREARAHRKHVISKQRLKRRMEQNPSNDCTGTFINNNMSLMYYNRAHVARGDDILTVDVLKSSSKKHRNTQSEPLALNQGQVALRTLFAVNVEVDFADSKFNEGESQIIALNIINECICYYVLASKSFQSYKESKIFTLLHARESEAATCKETPTFLENLFTNKDSRSSHFMKEIRNYNNIFAFTSMGGKIDHSINQGKGPYVFRIQGQNMHMLGSLLPPNGERPKFSQLYIYDTENEVSNRVKILSSSRENNQFDASIVLQISQLLDSCNPLVKQYQTVKDRCRSSNTRNLRLKLIRKRNSDARTYNLPTASEVAALIVGDIDLSTGERDIIVENKSGVLQHIDKLHPLYLPMQYPLLFPYGKDGYRPDTLYRDGSINQDRKQHNVTTTL
ncbi:helicase-like protein [Senna tora]|uniref:Helicase-like protein n=1 Tax=Senna tora TaxID=362788 RepID=A0A834WVN9_9FABA|nr:helicase-like protein [Senna tora]